MIPAKYEQLNCEVIVVNVNVIVVIVNVIELDVSYLCGVIYKVTLNCNELCQIIKQGIDRNYFFLNAACEICLLW